MRRMRASLLMLVVMLTASFGGENTSAETFEEDVRFNADRSEFYSDYEDDISAQNFTATTRTTSASAFLASVVLSAIVTSRVVVV
ncbi:MAG: hypothetical protein NT013_26825 [Planctomycetia bacterium]|nr:hypothetical protein [Planctomycetia bacterium]